MLCSGSGSPGVRARLREEGVPLWGQCVKIRGGVVRGAGGRVERADKKGLFIIIKTLRFPYVA